ncbi:ATPase subunit of ABC transporter with duplicated ATPase domains [Anseongella ginsenosidimutans]|uniref:ATPase subunit of ABC transporter with duplicated ATPase domains n=1 Tax=Anseongella ginsenosidimutans TaxID=496056 RepID=A0A4V2UTG6_9SPHI|nr:ABC-F family ATP-binding cassette domain-containing protein [Anseongella ginsenosidimutans]QEC53727.1 ABC-F family ATP-binding cassette domain-containing protein [Anseongella ginsenosidimutans]TCS86019.1 ATPase subunit of ABC transporter with duplicated ATPase domains [Anseongella ginsenosidimutans]
MSVTIKSLSYLHPDRETLFENLDFTIPKGGKVALVGNNGTGKSTLLQVIAGWLPPSAGQVILSEKAYYVPQHLGQYDHLSVAEALMVERKLNALRAILEGDAAAGNFADLEDDWEIGERVQAALLFWRLEHLDLWQRMKSLSGGEKTKVFLAGLLVHAPGVILLDEPSNHMDASSRDLLYDFIGKSKATILVVSHDKALLSPPDSTLELSAAGVELFGGNYDFYREQKESKLNALQSQLDEQAKMLKQAKQKARDMTAQRQKMEAKGKSLSKSHSLPRIVAGNLKRKAEQSTARLQGAHQEKVHDIADSLRQTRLQIRQSQALRINLKESGLHQGKVLVDARKIGFSYEKKNLWPPLSFQVRSGDRIRIEGENGSGKTTLLQLIMGRFQPAIGEIFKAEFSYLYLDQDYTLIDEQLSLFEQVQKYNTGNLEEHDLKSLLHYSQFSPEVWDRKCAGLSGGEKMKLTLCCLGISNNMPDMLILDEPTNNLDIQSLEVLTLAIKDYKGTLLVISHDRNFIEQIGISANIALDKISR